MFEFGNDVAVKICGVTNVQDASACARLGAEMIGLNFSPQSRRCLTPLQASDLVVAARAVRSEIKCVGVFVNQERSFIETIARDLMLDAVQLHGDESPTAVRNLETRFLIKALRVGDKFEARMAAEYESEAILLDGWNANAAGGTGTTFPWSMAAEVQPLVRRLFLAGGLTAENVADALAAARPFAVDVCSGVEDSPGQKNHDKIRHFIEAARAARRTTV